MLRVSVEGDDLLLIIAPPFVCPPICRFGVVGKSGPTASVHPGIGALVRQHPSRG